MARNFDFNKYKAIVDYISGASTSITTSIDNLIKGSVEMRQNSVASIVKYSTSITDIVIGRLSSVVKSDIWSTEGSIKLSVLPSSKIVFEEDYIYDEDSMLPSVINQKIIDSVGTKFVKRSSGIIVLQREYDASVVAFGANDVPSAKYFKDNFVTKEYGIAHGKITTGSTSVSNRKAGVNLEIASKLSGANSETKMVATRSKQMLSDFFDVNNDTVTFSEDPQSIIIGLGVDVKNSPTDKSLVTSKSIDSISVRKDLSNMKFPIMTSSGSDDENVQTTSQAISSLIQYGTVVDNVEVIPKEAQPSYATNVIHPDLLQQSAAKYAYDAIAEIGVELAKDKVSSSITGIGSALFRLNGIVPEGYSPEQEEVLNAVGNSAATIKSVYELVAARLFIINKKLFIDNAEYISTQNTAQLFLKTTSSPEFDRRPMLHSYLNDVAVADDLKVAIASLASEPTTTGATRSW